MVQDLSKNEQVHKDTARKIKFFTGNEKKP